MPTYEYECESCGHRFERFQNISDEPIENCPGCGKRVRRLIGAGAGLIVRSRGSYRTDYRRWEASTPCGKETTCCGRSDPCDAPPCKNGK